MKTQRLFVPLALCVLLFTPIARAEDVTIGAPLSMSGTYGYIGPDVQRGMLLAVDQINAAHEIGANRTLKIDVGDDASDRNQAITLVNRWGRGDTIAIAGPNSTVTALAVAPVVNDLKIPMLSIAVSSAVSKAGPWSYHVMAPPNLLMTALAKYVIDKLKPHTVMTVHGRDNEGAVAQIKAARDYMTGRVALLPEESALMAETDFSALATKIVDRKPDVVMIAMADANAASLIVQCRQAGLDEHTIFVGNNATASPSYIRIGGPAVEGSYMAADSFVQARRDPLATKFMADYRQRYDAAPSQWSAMGYTLIRVLARAMTGIDGPLTRDAVRDGIGRVRGFDTVLGSSDFSFDPAREPTYEPLVLTVRNGAFQLAP